MADPKIIEQFKKDLAKNKDLSTNNKKTKDAIDLLLNPTSNFHDETVRKNIYKGLALLYHPDKNPAGEVFFKLLPKITTEPEKPRDIDAVVDILDDIRSSLNPDAKRQTQHPKTPSKTNQQDHYYQQNFWQQHEQHRKQQQAEQEYRRYQEQHYQKTSRDREWQSGYQHSYDYYNEQYKQITLAIQSAHHNILYAYQQIPYLTNLHAINQYREFISKQYNTTMNSYALLQKNPYISGYQLAQIKNTINYTIIPQCQQSLILLDAYEKQHYQYQHQTSKTSPPKQKTQSTAIPKVLLYTMSDTVNLIKQARQNLNPDLYKKAIEKYELLFVQLDTYDQSIKKSLVKDIEIIKKLKDDMMRIYTNEHPNKEQTQTLDNYFNKNPNLPIKDKLEILLKVFEAINKLHNQGRIHGNLGLHDILYNINSESINIVESKGVTGRADSHNSITLPKSFMLSRYHAPECHNSHKATYRSDVYSLGKYIEKNIAGNNYFLQDLTAKMLVADPHYRINAESCIKEIKQELNKINDHKQPKRYR